MVSSKELQYVNLWANKVPMPGVDYSLKVLDEIKNCYELYVEKYKGKEYNMIFSNSEEISFEILSKNLCHMMGIDYNNIKGDYFNNYREKVFGSSSNEFNSYTLLEMILDNMEKVAEYDNDSKNPAKAVNYYKSAIKCAIFRRFSNFDKFNFAIINYAGDKESINYDNQKLLFVPSNEAVTPYFAMGIVKDGGDSVSNKYVVSTLMALDNPVTYFKNQEVVLPTQIMITDDNNLVKYVATPEEKLHLISMYENIIHFYNLTNCLNIYGDYKATLNEMANAKILSKKK